jgi:hypothetical protein
MRFVSSPVVWLALVLIIWQSMTTLCQSRPVVLVGYPDGRELFCYLPRLRIGKIECLDQEGLRKYSTSPIEQGQVMVINKGFGFCFV